MAEIIDKAVSKPKGSTWSRVGIAAGVMIAGFIAAKSLMRSNRFRMLKGVRFDQHIYHQIRTLIDGMVENPSAIDIDVDQGVVTLSGWIAESEVERLREDLRRTQGISEIVSFLETENARAVEFGEDLKESSRSNRSFRESSQTPPNLH